MARIARVVIPNVPHHIVQRGNRRQRVFFSDNDKTAYLEILRAQCLRFGVEIWAYCLMDNHVHFVAVPQDKDGLSWAFGQTHRHYTRMINFREKWRGYLWQGRFSSYALDENYLYAAIRYVEANPVKAGLVRLAEDYPWSSARARVYKTRDNVLSDFFLTKEMPEWSEFLRSIDPEDTSDSLLDAHLNTGRPLGVPEFINQLQSMTKVILTKLKPGPKSRFKVLN